MEKVLQNLKAQLRSLQVDTRVDFLLENAVKKGLAAFVVPYRMDKEKDILICELHVIRDNTKPHYKLDYYEATLLRRIEIPDLVVGEVSLAQLQLQLKDFAAAPQPRSPGKRTFPHMVSLNQLRASQQGSRLADLLTARYLPGEVKPDRFGYCLGYDRAQERFSLSRKFAAKEKTGLVKCYHMLASVIASKVPRFSLLELSQQQAIQPDKCYTVRAAVMDIKTGEKKMITANKTFTDPAQLVNAMQALDPRLFDRTFIIARSDQLTACLHAVFLYEAGSALPVLTIDNTMKDARHGVKLELSMTHPTLGAISFSQGVFKHAGLKAIDADMDLLRRPLVQLGLARERKKIISKVTAAVAPKRVTSKRRGGRPIG